MISCTEEADNRYSRFSGESGTKSSAFHHHGLRSIPLGVTTSPEPCIAGSHICGIPVHKTYSSAGNDVVSPVNRSWIKMTDTVRPSRLRVS